MSSMRVLSLHLHLLLLRLSPDPSRLSPPSHPHPHAPHALFSSLSGYAGRLGHGNQETKPRPQLVEALTRECITSAVAGSEFTVALTSRGAAYSFGIGDMTGTVWWGRGE